MKCLPTLLLLLLIAPSFLFYVPNVQCQSDWWNSSWQYRMQLSYDYSKIDANQTDFPLLVHLNYSRVSWEAIKDNLADLRFVSNNETLAHEIESYIVNSEAWIWVKVNTTQSLFMYYGNSIASSIENKTAVWETTNVMTQHMKDETTSTILDSTSYNNDGTKKAANEPVEIAGKIGEALSFDGVNDRILNTAFTIDGYGKLTISALVKYSVSQDNKEIVGWWYNYNNHLCIQNNQIWLRLWNGATGVNVISDSVLNDNLFHFVVGTYDKDVGTNNVILYIDGVKQVSTSTLTGVLAVSDAFGIGGYGSGGGGGFFTGIIDEVRIYNRALTVEWIKASYYSESDTLLSFGSEQNYEAPTPEPTVFPPYAYVAIILAVAALTIAATYKKK